MHNIIKQKLFIFYFYFIYFLIYLLRYVAPVLSLFLYQFPPMLICRSSDYR